MTIFWMYLKMQTDAIDEETSMTRSRQKQTWMRQTLMYLKMQTDAIDEKTSMTRSRRKQKWFDVDEPGLFDVTDLD